MDPAATEPIRDVEKQTARTGIIVAIAGFVVSLFGLVLGSDDDLSSNNPVETLASLALMLSRYAGIPSVWYIPKLLGDRAPASLHILTTLVCAGDFSNGLSTLTPQLTAIQVTGPALMNLWLGIAYLSIPLWARDLPTGTRVAIALACAYLLVDTTLDAFTGRHLGQTGDDSEYASSPAPLLALLGALLLWGSVYFAYR